MVSVRISSALMAFGLLLSGCATAPQEGASANQPIPAATPVAEGTADAPPVDTVASASPAGEEALSAAEVAAQARVVDLNKQPIAETENSGQVCRVMLRPNTNSLVNVCGTPAQWKKYQEAEAHAAQELLLKMQLQQFR
jgi:hypothetical protein